MRRVEATHRERRKRVVTKRREGKVKNSMGLTVYRERRSTIKEKVRLKLKSRSRSRRGRGKIITKRVMITPRATQSSPLWMPKPCQKEVGAGGATAVIDHLQKQF
jgi:hypothetical protein